MKVISFLLVVSGFFFLTSCGEECNEETLEVVIIGTWEQIKPVPNGTIEFLEDGTLQDTDDILFGSTVVDSQLLVKTYNVFSDTEITIKVTFGNNTIGKNYNVISYDCEQIILRYLELERTLIKT